MKATVPRFPARYVVALADCVEAMGVSREDLESAAGLRSPVHTLNWLTMSQVERLLAAAERLTGRTDLGFELGRRVKTTSHDLLGYALLTSPTLREALRLLAVYQRLINPAFTLALVHGGGRVELVYRPAIALSPRAMRVLQETIAVSNDQEFRALLNRGLPPYDLRLSVERPTHVARYRELPAARVHWDDPVPGLRLSIDAALLDRPLALADAAAMHAAEERCAAQLRRGRGGRRWSEWCRTMLRESSDSQPTLEELSRFVNLSPRTLARYLEAEGRGFRELSLEVRMARARAMLRTGNQSVTRIAYALGYGDAASFVRSFRRVTGRSPAAWAAASARRHHQPLDV